ncbi:amidohydrolase family protein [Sphingomonas sp. 67-36]|uniref:amidohydrolase family protein n=1 Tax=Sphingomonas sp. 67-36 TaxID=1895849 RepID=UPI0025D1555D|nr:amidohydrolase family protein [Sphingomonas sp. 67-36]
MRITAILGAFAAVAVAGAAPAREARPGGDVVLTNVRVITGTGKVIEHGAIVVADGKIVSVAEGAAPRAARGTRIDASGMTAIAGYIDTHRHLIPMARPGAGPTVAQYLAGDAARDMQALLESGITTVQSGGDDAKGIIALRDMVAEGKISGPRIIAGAWAFPPVLAPRTMTEAQVRAAIDAIHDEGADSVAEIPYPTIASMTADTQWPFNPTEQETRNLAAALDEGKKLGMEVQVHAVSPPAQVAATRLGARRLVHSSHYAFMTDAEAKEIAATGAMVASSVANASPLFGVFNHDNKPTTRDGAPWPGGNPAAEDRGQAAGKFPLNLRTLYDNGVTVAYSSDTSFDPTATLAHELNTLSLVFSPVDLVRIIGPNSAAFVDHAADRGTLEPGKLGDILLLTGNPLDGYWNFLKPVVVIKDGKVVVDKRGELRTVRTL